MGEHSQELCPGARLSTAPSMAVLPLPVPSALKPAPIRPGREIGASGLKALLRVHLPICDVETVIAPAQDCLRVLG